MSVRLGDLGPLPLVLGITGHRNAPARDYPQLEAAVRKVFDELREDYPHTPLVLLSPLAEGADRLAARVALQCGVELIARLPMEIHDYESDFQTQESHREFHALLSKASRCFVVGDDTLKENRDRQYALVGAHVVRCCHILLALWDGKPSELTGSTAQIVQYKLEGIPEDVIPAADPLDPPEVGPVYQIVTPREGGGPPVGTPFERVVRLPGFPEQAAAAESSFLRKLDYIERFNADAARAGSAEIQSSSLLSEECIQKLPPGMQDSLRSIESVFQAADAMSAKYERKARGVSRLLFGVGFPAALCLQLSGRGGSLGLYFTLGFLAMLVLAYGVLLYAVKRSDAQNRYQDYRGLAEGLRVQYFWTLTGVGDWASHHYLRRQEADLEWIRLAMRSCEAYLPPPSSEPSHQRLALDCWVIDQRNWFTRRVRQRRIQIARIAAGAFELLAIGITLSLVAPALRLWISEKTTAVLNTSAHSERRLLVTALVPLVPLLLWMLQSALEVRKLAGSHSRYRPTSTAGEGAASEGVNLYAISRGGIVWKLLRDMVLALAIAGIAALAVDRRWFSIASQNTMALVVGICGLAFALGAVFFYAYAEKRGWAMHLKQYLRMLKLLTVAERGISSAIECNATDRARRLFGALGREALAQNEEWLLLHRERPLDVPQ